MNYGNYCTLILYLLHALKSYTPQVSNYARMLVSSTSCLASSLADVYLERATLEVLMGSINFFRGQISPVIIPVPCVKVFKDHSHPKIFPNNCSRLSLNLSKF